MKEKKEDFVKREGAVFPGKTYADQLLRYVFEDQRDYLRDYMFSIHFAHVVMLAEEGIISAEDAKVIVTAVRHVQSMDLSCVSYDSQYEDWFFLIEDYIQQEAGHTVGSNMHIGRSRNDMGVAMYRMALRSRLLQLHEQMVVLGESLLERADEQKETIVTAYTHTQPAQPTALGHYLLAVYDVLYRDMKRISAAFDTVNRSPLGAAALSTTGFPINRMRVCELLGFDRLQENSYDAIASADYLLEVSAVVAIMMTNTGRWIQDLLVLTTKEFGGITIADPYVQISSIMPQKRNPVSVEHSRALASSSCADALAAFHMIHNTPYGDIVDTEDDLQPHLYRSLEKATRVIRIMNAVVRTMEIDKQKLEERAKKHAITITELADMLTHKGVPFRSAHKLASAVAKKSAAEQKELYEFCAGDVNAIIGASLTEEEWQRIASPKAFVESRCIEGGPCVKEIERMLKVRTAQLKKEEEQLMNRKQRLQAADAMLMEAVNGLQKEHLC